MADEDQQFALFCTMATAFQFYELLAKSRHIYSHVSFGIFPSPFFKKCKLYKKIKRTSRKVALFSELTLSRREDDRSDGPVGYSYSKYPVCCAG